MEGGAAHHERCNLRCNSSTLKRESLSLTTELLRLLKSLRHNRIAQRSTLQETRQAAGEVSRAAKRAAQRSVFLLAST